MTIDDNERTYQSRVSAMAQAIAEMRAAQAAVPQQPRPAEPPEPGRDYIESNGQRVYMDPPASPESQEIGRQIRDLRLFGERERIDPRMVERMVGQTVSDSFADRRRQMQAGRDADAIAKSIESGLIPQDSIQGVLDSYDKEYGVSGMQNPTYQKLRGVRGNVLAAQEDKLNNFAQSNGIGRNYVQWDDRHNQPTLNPMAFQLDELKARRRQQGVREAATGANVIGKQITALTSVIKAQGDKADPRFRYEFNTLVRRQMEMLRAIPGSTPAATAAPPPQEPSQDLIGAIQAVQNQKSPPVVAGELSFATRDDVIQAFHDGRLQDNIPFTLNGQRVRIENGKLRKL